MQAIAGSSENLLEVPRARSRRRDVQRGLDRAAKRRARRFGIPSRTAPVAGMAEMARIERGQRLVLRGERATRPVAELEGAHANPAAAWNRSLLRALGMASRLRRGPANPQAACGEDCANETGPAARG
jgi:hypothetical protein